MLTFDPDSHIYFWNGAPVPNVTSLLDVLIDFSAIPKSIMDAARLRGTIVHLICELHDIGELDPDAIPAELAGYYEAYSKFHQAHTCKWLGIEERVYHPLLKYAGTADRRGLIDDRPAVLDIKTTQQIYATVGPQISAYLEAYRAAGTIPKKQPTARLCLRLGDDGNYALDTLAQSREKPDWAAFTACLTIHNHRRNHGIART